MEPAVNENDNAGDDAPAEENDTAGITFNPILPTVEIKTLEDDEDVIYSVRSKLYRYANELDPPEWKERGVGECRLLRHRSASRVRLLMRRDKTLKICANHFLHSSMTLSHHESAPNRERTWIWTTPADFAEEAPRKELFCLRFGTLDLANAFREAFENAIKELASKEKADTNENANSPDKTCASPSSKSREKSDSDTNPNPTSKPEPSTLVTASTSEKPQLNNSTSNIGDAKQTNPDPHEGGKEQEKNKESKPAPISSQESAATCTESKLFEDLKQLSISSSSEKPAATTSA